MLTLNDGRAELWQWDTGRTLAVDADCSQVHFSNKVFGRSIDVDVVDGVAIIPDVLLQTDKDLNVWAFVGTADNGYTKISKTFKVNRRNKPADYVFTPTDQITLQTIQSQLGDLSDLTTEAKDTLVAAINEAARTGGGGGSTVELDTTLTQSGKAADAKAVGDALAGKQDTISDLEAIRTGAAKGATALQSVPSTYRTASEQDTIDDGKVDKVTGKGLSSNDYTDAAKAKVDALAPVATSGSYNDLTYKPTIPTALPNPNALTFTGAVTGSYDGSAPVSVEIPSGGGSGGSASLQLLAEDTLTEDTATIYVDGFSADRLAFAVAPYGSTANSGNVNGLFTFGFSDDSSININMNSALVTNTASKAWNKYIFYVTVNGNVLYILAKKETGTWDNNIDINILSNFGVTLIKMVLLPQTVKITSLSIGLASTGVIGANTQFKVVCA